MTLLLQILFIMAVTFTYTYAVSFAAAIKPRIALFMPVPKNMEAIPLMDSIPSRLAIIIGKSSHLVAIMERKTIEQELEREGYKLDSITMNELLRVSERLGFDYAIMGDILKQHAVITANIRVVDIRNQKVSFDHTISATEGGLNDKIDEVAAVIIERILAVAKGGSPEAFVLPPPRDLRMKSEARKITIHWSYSNVQDVSGFKIFRATGKQGAYIQIGTTTDTFFVDENPVLNESLLYKITAINKQGIEGRFSDAIEARTVAGSAQPIFLSADPDIKAAHLRWKAWPGSEVAGFRIYRREASEKDFKQALSVSENLSYSDGGLKDDTVYYYAITAVDSKGTESDMSQVLSLKTPRPPEGLRAEGGKIRRILLSWNVYQADIEGYIIYRAPKESAEYKQIARIVGKTTNTYSDVEGLGDGVPYWYRVSAFKNSSETDLSSSVSAVTRGAPPAPQGFTAKSHEPRRVSMRWEPVQNPDDEIGGYRIYRATEEKGEYREIAYLPDASAASFVEDGLKDNTYSYYKIASYNSADVRSDMSQPASAVTKHTPAVPRGLEATSGEVKQVSLTWEPNPEKDMREYVIFRAMPGDGTLNRIASVMKETTYTDTDLQDGITYAYAIQAVDEDGLFSDQSKPVTAETKPLPKKPAGLKVVDSGDKKVLQWDSNPEKDVRQYNLYKKGFLNTSQKIATIQAVSWTIPDDMKGKLRLFVTALDDAGLESEASDGIEIVVGALSKGAQKEGSQSSRGSGEDR